MKNKKFNATAIRKNCQTTNEQGRSKVIFATMMPTPINNLFTIM